MSADTSETETIGRGTRPRPDGSAHQQTTSAHRVRAHYPIIDVFDTDPGAPLDVTGFVLLDGRIEARRTQLETELEAAILVYAASHRIAPTEGHHLCQRATAAPLDDDQVDALRRFEASLERGQVACAYRRPPTATP